MWNYLLFATFSTNFFTYFQKNFRWPGENAYGRHSAGMWNDLYEHRELGYMCSHKLDYALPAPPVENDCPYDWVAATGITGAGSYCYKMITDVTANFDGAQEYCAGLKSETGHTTNLVSIEDEYEVIFLEDNFER